MGLLDGLFGKPKQVLSYNSEQVLKMQEQLNAVLEVSKVVSGVIDLDEVLIFTVRKIARSLRNC